MRWSMELRMPLGVRKCFGFRRNFHVGTRARVTSQVRTSPQITRTLVPPSQSNALRIFACGDIAKRNKLINAVPSSCNSAGRRLVLTSESRTRINVRCNGYKSNSSSESRFLRDKGVGDVDEKMACSEKTIGMAVINQCTGLRL